ncbi:hypothetical protein Pve01_02790 [Planomonospora venezuelensis]|nr:hypothetical protein Pve01_02790 [Planomonospora venezuelensis]
MDVLPELGADLVLGEPAGQRHEVAGLEAEGAGKDGGCCRSTVQPRQVETEDWGADQGIHGSSVTPGRLYTQLITVFITNYHGVFWIQHI